MNRDWKIDILRTDPDSGEQLADGKLMFMVTVQDKDGGPGDRIRHAVLINITNSEEGPVAAEIAEGLSSIADWMQETSLHDRPGYREILGR